MDFCINKDYFGTDFHLVCYENGKIEKLFKCDPPKDMINVYSKQAMEIANLYGFRIYRFPSYKYRKFFIGQQKQHKNMFHVPWENVLPKLAYKDEVKKHIAHLKQNFGPIDINYYKFCYLPQNGLFKELKPAKIDAERFVDIVSSEHDAHLKTFAPTSGFARPVVYSRFSKTGRLKVISGPMINNLTKEHRNIIVSRFKNGKVLQLDFSSLEPRIFLAIKNIEVGNEDVPKDIYQDFTEKNSLKHIPRSKLKNAILSRMYGAGNNLIESQLEGLVDYPEQVVSMIDDYLGVDSLKEKVLQEFERNSGSRIYNFYGRPVDCEEASPHSLLNYYIQSTAMDVSLFGFNEIIRRIKLAGLSEFIVPIFVLHDALFLDVHPKYEFVVGKLRRCGSINIPKFESVDFHLKVEELV